MNEFQISMILLSTCYIKFSNENLWWYFETKLIIFTLTITTSYQDSSFKAPMAPVLEESGV